MTDYYVSTTGNDSDAGTVGSPFLTWQKGIDSAVSPGDQVIGRGGTYNENAAILNSGSAGNTIHLTSYPAEQAFIDGGSGAALSDTVGCDYIEISRLKLKSTADSHVADYCLGQSHFPTGSSNHWHIHDNLILGHTLIMGANNLFEDNEVDGEGTLADGVREYGDVSHHNTYLNNNVHDCITRGFWTDHETHDGLWEDNTITSCRSGIDTDGYGQVVYLHTLRHNTIDDASESGIQLENTWASIIENNIISNSPVGIDGISYGNANDFGHSPHITLVDIYGDASDGEGVATNTILRQNSCFAVGIGIQLNRMGGVSILGNTLEADDKGINFFEPSTGIIIQSNIIVAPIRIQGVTTLGSIVTDDHNLFDGNPAYTDDAGDYSLAAYQVSSGLGANSLVADPLLTAHIISDSSPAVDTGVDIDTTTDLRGHVRPQGSGVDIGAYETGADVGGGGGSTPPVLTGSDRIAVQDISEKRHIFASIDTILALGAAGDFVAKSGDTMTGDLSLGGNELLDYAEHAAAATISASPYAIDWSVQGALELLLEADVTLTFSSLAAGRSLTLLLIQDGTGGWDVTFPGSVAWLGGSAPTFDTGANVVNLVALFVREDGTSVLAAAPQALPSGGGSAGDYICIEEQQATSTSAGTFTSGSWISRELNTEVSDAGGHASVSTNQVTLAAGTYRIRATAPAFNVEQHQARWYNISDSTEDALGTSAYADSGGHVQTVSEIDTEFTIAGSKTFELQHRCQATETGDGFGVGNGFGSVMVYSRVVLIKVA